MNSKEIICSAMTARGFNQTMLAQAAGLKRQTNVSELLRSESMRVDNFVKLLDAMGYEVVVKDKNTANKTKWVVGNGVSSKAKDESLGDSSINLDELLSDNAPVSKSGKGIKIKLSSTTEEV